MLEGHPDALTAFQGFLTAMGQVGVHDLLNKVRFPAGPLRLLEVGGGAGLHSINFCKRYPEYSATHLRYTRGS